MGFSHGISWDIPSGKLLHDYGKSPFSMALGDTHPFQEKLGFIVEIAILFGCSWA